MIFLPLVLSAELSVDRAIPFTGCARSVKHVTKIPDNDEKKSLSINLDGLCFGRSFGGTVWSMSYLRSVLVDGSCSTTVEWCDRCVPMSYSRVWFGGPRYANGGAVA